MELLVTGRSVKSLTTEKPCSCGNNRYKLIWHDKGKELPIGLVYLKCRKCGKKLIWKRFIESFVDA